MESEVFSQKENLARGKAIKSSNPLLLGKTPYQYMLNVIKQIPSHDLEQSLLFLPFHYVKRFIPILVEVSLGSIWSNSDLRSLSGYKWIRRSSAGVSYFSLNVMNLRWSPPMHCLMTSSSYKK